MSEHFDVLAHPAAVADAEDDFVGQEIEESVGHRAFSGGNDATAVRRWPARARILEAFILDHAAAEVGINGVDASRMRLACVHGVERFLPCIEY